MVRSFKGGVRCPVCAAWGTSQESIDRHIVRKSKFDNEHFRLRDLAADRLRSIKQKV